MSAAAGQGLEPQPTGTYSAGELGPATSFEETLSANEVTNQGGFEREPAQQPAIDFAAFAIQDDAMVLEEESEAAPKKTNTARDLDAILRREIVTSNEGRSSLQEQTAAKDDVSEPAVTDRIAGVPPTISARREQYIQLPPLNSAEKYAHEVPVESLTPNIRPLGQLDESFIIATDDEGLLLIDQHVAHERILFDKYRALESNRTSNSQQLLLPETFDLTPAQAAAFDLVAEELEHYGFDLMRLSGRTVAIKATPADLPANEARNMLAEVLDTVDAEKQGTARETLRDEIAASLACHAAIKVNMPLAPEKMRWLIDRLLVTSSPTTCPHGRPVILRLATKDILKGFHRI
jgi:DNA mismatch repair protein MutL